MFNGNVSTAFYGANLSPDRLLSFVLSNPQQFSGAPIAGTDPRMDPAQGGTALNAFNATGAYLTDLIPGFHFDPSLIGDETACPIDNHGNFKE